MTGTQNQIEWASLIKPRVAGEFDRVANAFVLIANRQQSAARARTLATVAILEEIRAAVLAHDDAGYFIKEWQEITDQVRMMIVADPRYRALKASGGPR